MSPGERQPRAAAIVGVSGSILNAAEGRLFEQKQPCGFILFARNCQHPDQVGALVQALRSTVDDPRAPVLIDQEGGRVSRLKPPHWSSICAPRRLGDLAERDLAKAKEAAWLHARLIASDLEPLGITVNCAPVLDLAFAAQTEAIGDRALSHDPAIVAILARAMIDGYLAGGVLPVIKHLPGHGRALVDSHVCLPHVDASLADVADKDWLPFQACSEAPFGMTAHVRFACLDPERPATQSAPIINEIIWDKIGFKGALLSDDLSMNALGGGLGERAAAATSAGCDLAVHCNGDLEEMTEVLDAAGPLVGEARSRVDQALARRSLPEAFDIDDGRARLDDLLARIGVDSGATC